MLFTLLLQKGYLKGSNPCWVILKTIRVRAYWIAILPLWWLANFTQTVHTIISFLCFCVVAFFQVAYICNHTREFCSKVGRELLSSIIQTHPNAISFLLARVKDVINKLGKVKHTQIEYIIRKINRKSIYYTDYVQSLKFMDYPWFHFKSLIADWEYRIIDTRVQAQLCW